MGDFRGERRSVVLLIRLWVDGLQYAMTDFLQPSLHAAAAGQSLQQSSEFAGGPGFLGILHAIVLILVFLREHCDRERKSLLSGRVGPRVLACQEGSRRCRAFLAKRVGRPIGEDRGEWEAPQKTAGIAQECAARRLSLKNYPGMSSRARVVKSPMKAAAGSDDVRTETEASMRARLRE